MWKGMYTCVFQRHFTNWYLETFIWNWSCVSATEPHDCSCNGLLLSENASLPEPTLNQISLSDAYLHSSFSKVMKLYFILIHADPNITLAIPTVVCVLGATDSDHHYTCKGALRSNWMLNAVECTLIDSASPCTANKSMLYEYFVSLIKAEWRIYTSVI